MSKINTRLSPQELRKKNLLLISTLMRRTSEWQNVNDFKLTFIFNTGASKFKVDEYFDLATQWLRKTSTVEFSEDKTQFRVILNESEKMP